MANKVQLSVGPEVNHTPANSKKTLFVEGMVDKSVIDTKARENKTAHIHLTTSDFNKGDLAYWDNTITALLDSGFWVTFEYPAHQHNVVFSSLNKGIWQSRIFVPLLSVAVPDIQTSNANLCLKITDSDKKSSNNGVWCLHFKEVVDSNRFTDWSEFISDVITEPESVVEAVNEVVVINEAPPVDVIETPPVVESLNDEAAGLDVEPTTALKPDPEEVLSTTVYDLETAVDAYTEGTTVDPLSEKQSKKPKAKKNDIQ